MANVAVLLLTILCVVQVKAHDVDYYWRDYNGLIPEDALPGGRDINGKDTYIGQIYMHGFGLFIGQIIPGKLEINVPCHGVRKQNYAIKILCTKHKNNFGWLSTTSTSFHVDTIEKHVVVGGYNHFGARKGILNIGRVKHQGILKIGPVASHQVENVYFYYVHSNKLEKATAYEVLIYDDSAPTLDVRAFVE
jgi:hypothetical protein